VTLDIESLYKTDKRPYWIFDWRFVTKNKYLPHGGEFGFVGDPFPYKNEARMGDWDLEYINPKTQERYQHQTGQGVLWEDCKKKPAKEIVDEVNTQFDEPRVYDTNTNCIDSTDIVVCIGVDHEGWTAEQAELVESLQVGSSVTIESTNEDGDELTQNLLRFI
jgi:hypothetical protein